MGWNLASGEKGWTGRKDRLEWIKMSFGKYYIAEGEPVYKSI